MAATAPLHDVAGAASGDTAVSGDTAASGRRSQAERRAATQRRLLDATIEALAEHGYAGMSTNDVVRRAGVSRGALVHHFPTKAQLGVAALDRWLDDRLVEFEATFAALEPGERRLDVAIDVLWQMFTGPTFAAWLELTVAARTDADLRTRLSAVDARFNDGVEQTFRRTFAVVDTDGTDPAGAVRFAFTVLSGAALHHVIEQGQPTAAAPEAIATLKSLAQLLGNESGRST